MRSCAPDTSCIFNQSISAVSTSVSPPPSIHLFSLPLSPPVLCFLLPFWYCYCFLVSLSLSLFHLFSLNICSLLICLISLICLCLISHSISRHAIFLLAVSCPISVFVLLLFAFLCSKDYLCFNYVLYFIYVLKTGSENAPPFWLTLEIIHWLPLS